MQYCSSASKIKLHAGTAIYPLESDLHGNGFVWLSHLHAGEYKLPLPALELLNYDRLQGLIRLPRGCGEQTLLALTPLVYAMNYLEDGGLLLGNKAKREEGIKNIRRG